MSEVGEAASMEVGYIPILCTAPLLYAHSRGLFERNGLNVKLKAAAGWSAIKELLVYQKLDAVHMLCPMPLACALGLDGRPAPLKLCLVQNRNGQALTLANRYAAIRQPRELRGLCIGVPYGFSMQTYLLQMWLADHGIDPGRDVEVKAVSPARMPYYLSKGWIDAMLAPEPYNQIAVARGIGFIAFTSQDIWPGHPCCGIALHEQTIKRHPVKVRALLRSIVQAQRELQAANPEELLRISEILSTPQYLNQSDPRLISAALSGQFVDGRGTSHCMVDYIEFTPQVPPELGDWLLSQMQRWGQLPGKVDYAQTVNAVFSAELSNELALAEGMPAPAAWRAGMTALPRGEAAFQAMRTAPFCAYHETASAPPAAAIPEPLRDRLAVMLDELAEVAGGKSELALDVSIPDELGWLARMLNEVVLNLRYMREALSEQLAVEDLARRQQLQLAAQNETLRQLAVPIIPIIAGILVVPLIGAISRERSEQITARVLAATTEHRARFVMLDITGIPYVDDLVAKDLLQLGSALRLLGVDSAMVGVSALLARQLVSARSDIGTLRSFADLQSGLAYALQRIGCRIAPLR